MLLLKCSPSPPPLLYSYFWLLVVTPVELIIISCSNNAMLLLCNVMLSVVASGLFIELVDITDFAT